MKCSNKLTHRIYKVFIEYVGEDRLWELSKPLAKYITNYMNICVVSLQAKVRYMSYMKRLTNDESEGRDQLT